MESFLKCRYFPHCAVQGAMVSILLVHISEVLYMRLYCMIGATCARKVPALEWLETPLAKNYRTGWRRGHLIQTLWPNPASSSVRKGNVAKPSGIQRPASFVTLPFLTILYPKLGRNVWINWRQYRLMILIRHLSNSLCYLQKEPFSLSIALLCQYWLQLTQSGGMHAYVCMQMFVQQCAYMTMLRFVLCHSINTSCLTDTGLSYSLCSLAS